VWNSVGDSSKSHEAVEGAPVKIQVVSRIASRAERGIGIGSPGEGRRGRFEFMPKKPKLFET